MRYYSDKKRRSLGLIEDLDNDLSFLDSLDFVDMEDVKQIAIVGGSAAVAGVAWSFVENKFIAQKVQNDYLKAGIKAGIGIVAASLLSRYNRNIALGIGAGLVGSAFSDLVRKFVPLSGVTIADNDNYVLPEPYDMPVAGYLSQGSDEEEDTGIPTEGVEEERLYGVEEEKLYGVDEEREVIY